MNRIFVAFLVGLFGSLLWSTAASAQNWIRECQGSRTTQNLSTGGSYACYDFTADTDSNILQLSQCENFDVFFDPDITGADTTATVNIWHCVANEKTNSCRTIYTDTNPTLDSTITKDAIFGAAGVFIYVEVVAPPPGGETARVLVHCNT